MRPRPEWIGAKPTSEIPGDVKLRIVLRGNGRCVDCGRKFGPKLKPVFDHRPALANGGENRESKIFARCETCHKPHTAADIKERAKTKRMQKAALGIDKPSTFRKPAGAKFNWRKGRYERPEHP